MQRFVIVNKILASNESESWSRLPENGSSLVIPFFQEVSTRPSPFATFNDWGPKRDPLFIVVPITVVYVLTFLTGVVGNVSTCIVIARNKSMHTATNYYLFSLAVSDLLLLISGLPPEIYMTWYKYPYVFGETFCILQGFAAETSANATVLTITAFTVERYVAICHPFLSHTLSKLSRAIKFVVAIWVAAMCLALPQAMSFEVTYEHTSDGRVIDDHCVCMVNEPLIPFSFEISTVVFFITPMVLISALYIRIGQQLRKSTVGPTRSNSVKLNHRLCKPVVNHTVSTMQTVLIQNGHAGDHQPTSAEDDEGRKNFAKNARATKHVVNMLSDAVVVAESEQELQSMMDRIDRGLKNMEMKLR